MKDRKNKLTRHHIIWKCNRSRAHIDDETNIHLLRLLDHQALNTLFKHNQCPHEQLQVMFEIREPVLSDRVRLDLQDILELDTKDFYKIELVKK